MPQDPNSTTEELTRALSPLSASSDGSWVALSGEYTSLHGGVSSTGALLPGLGRPGLINAQELGEDASSGSSPNSEDESPQSVLALLMSRPVRLPLLVASNLVILALGLFLGRRALLSLDASVIL